VLPSFSGVFFLRFAGWTIREITVVLGEMHLAAQDAALHAGLAIPLHPLAIIIPRLVGAGPAGHLNFPFEFDNASLRQKNIRMSLKVGEKQIKAKNL
jgi:hypothetical protein